MECREALELISCFLLGISAGITVHVVYGIARDSLLGENDALRVLFGIEPWCYHGSKMMLLLWGGFLLHGISQYSDMVKRTDGKSSSVLGPRVWGLHASMLCLCIACMLIGQWFFCLFLEAPNPPRRVEKQGDGCVPAGHPAA